MKGDRPKSIWNPSPNFTPCDPGRKISCVVLHATASADKESAIEWLCDPKSKVSIHYLIDPLGAIYHLVHEQNIAWDCGVSDEDGMHNVNSFSVGVELVNPNDGKTTYPIHQLAACADLVADICTDFGISCADVVGHKDIAQPPGRKTDPAGLDLNAFRNALIKRGVPRQNGGS